jgi:hypothetical protein
MLKKRAALSDLSGWRKSSKKEYLGSKDVAWIIDLSPDDVVELARQKKLVGAKTGRLWRFRPDLSPEDDSHRQMCRSLADPQDSEPDQTIY